MALAAVVAVLLTFAQPSLDIFPESLFRYYRPVIQDPFLRVPTPQVSWVDPRRLIRHEFTSRPHLESLIAHLQSLPPTAPVPIPVVTASEPQVILDGHHRVAASRILGLSRIPVWVVDDSDEVANWEKTLVRCYSRATGRRLPLRLVVERARAGNIDWGIKGTRHVAFLQSSVTLIAVAAADSINDNSTSDPFEFDLDGDRSASQSRSSDSEWNDTDNGLDPTLFEQQNNTVEVELELERVTPRIDWASWKAGGDPQSSPDFPVHEQSEYKAF